MSANTAKLQITYNCKIFYLGSSKYNLLTCFKFRLFSYWHTLLYSKSDWTSSFVSYSWKLINIFKILSENLDLYCWCFSHLERGLCAYKQAFVLEIALLLPILTSSFFFSSHCPVAPHPLKVTEMGISFWRDLFPTLTFLNTFFKFKTQRDDFLPDFLVLFTWTGSLTWIRSTYESCIQEHFRK